MGEFVLVVSSPVELEITYNLLVISLAWRGLHSHKELPPISNIQICNQKSNDYNAKMSKSLGITLYSGEEEVKERYKHEKLFELYRS